MSVSEISQSIITPMLIHPIDLAVIVAYFLGIMGLGLLLSRRTKDTETYYLGNKSFPGWAIGISLIGTMISSLTFIAGPADSFKTAYLRSVPQFMVPLGAIIVAFFLVPVFRRGVTSAYEYLDRRFGPGISAYAATIFLFAQITKISMVAYLVSILFQFMTGFPFHVCLVITAGITAIYTAKGGFTAVVWTDLVQTFILVIGAFVAIAFICKALPGGLGQVIDQGWELNKISFWDSNTGTSRLEPITWNFTLAEKSIFALFVIGVINFLGQNIDQKNVQRWCSTRTCRDAQVAVLIFGFGTVFVWTAFKFLGTALFVFFHQFPAVIPTEILGGVRKAEEIVPYFIVNHLPHGVAGIVIAGALAAAMATLSASINSSSMVWVRDIYGRFLFRDRTDAHYLRMGKATAWMAALGMVVGASLVHAFSTQTMADLYMILSSLIGSSLAGIFFLGIFTRKANTKGVCCGIAANLLVVGYIMLGNWNILPVEIRLPIYSYYAGAIGNLVTFTVGLIASRFFAEGPKELRNLTVWTQDAKSAA